jgi:hypothetical protein
MISTAASQSVEAYWHHRQSDFIQRDHVAGCGGPAGYYFCQELAVSAGGMNSMTERFFLVEPVASVATMVKQNLEAIGIEVMDAPDVPAAISLLQVNSAELVLIEANRPPAKRRPLGLVQPANKS